MRPKSLKVTPKNLYQSIQASFDASEYISLINDLRNAMNKLYTVDRLGNVWGGRPVLYVNTECDVLEMMVIKMLRDDVPVWYLFPSYR
jgi:bleomycin hydrolase